MILARVLLAAAKALRRAEGMGGWDVFEVQSKENGHPDSARHIGGTYWITASPIAFVSFSPRPGVQPRTTSLNLEPEIFPGASGVRQISGAGSSRDKRWPASCL